MIFASSSVGAGHNQAAAAVMAALEGLDPAIRADFTDALRFVPWWFRFPYVGLYTLGVTKIPRAYGLGYRLMDSPRGAGRPWYERSRLLTERYALREYRRHVLRRRPVLVVATHYLAAPTIGWMIGRKVKGLRLWMVVTDTEAHRFWYAENVERYFVADPQVAEQLTGWGVDPARIVVSGIPVHPKWTAPLDRRTVRRDWNLPADAPVVLVTGGAYFTVGPVEQIVRGLLARCGVHVVVLAGSNKRLLARLAKLSRSSGRVTGVAFTDRVHELVEAASVVVTKAGGLMTSECVARGAAMVLTRPVPGQEAANAELLSRSRAAVVAPTTDEVIACVARLLAAPAEAEGLRNNARRLYKPASQTIAAAIAEAVRMAP